MADPISQQGLYQDGNSIFENVHILGTLEVSGIVNTENNFTTTGSVKALKFLGDGSELTGIDATTIKDSAGTIRIQGTTTGATHSGRAVFTEVEITGKLYDGVTGEMGSAGKVLSSTGSQLEWINTSAANVGSATNVGVNLDSTDASQFVSFVGANSGNQPNRVNDSFRYNPSTNTLAAINIASAVITGNLKIDGQLKDGTDTFGGSGAVLTSDGTKTVWDNVGNLSAGSAAKLSVTEDDTLTDGRLLFSNAAGQSGGNEIKSDNDLTYNASSNTLTVTNLSGTATQAANLNNHDTDDLSEGSTNEYFTNSRARAAISVGAEGSASGDGSISYNNSTGVLTFTPAAAAGTPTAISVQNEATDTQCFPLFALAAVGDMAPKSNLNLTFNSATGSLSATSFSGSGISLTNLNASNLGSGALPNARLQGPYTNTVTIGSVRIGEWTGNASYKGIFHTNQGGAEYMIMSNDTHTYISATTGSNVYIRNGNNDSTNQLIIGSGNDALTWRGNKVFHEGNLTISDFLTNTDESNYLKSNADDVLTKGTLTTFSASLNDWMLRLVNNNGTNAYVYLCHSTHGVHIRNDSSTTATYLLDVYAANGNRFRVRGADAYTTINGNAVYHTGNLTPFDGNYNSLSNKPTIPTVPTNISSFTNNVGYITGTDVRSMNEATSTGQSSTTSTSFQNKVTLSISTVSNSRVLIAYAFEIKHSNTNNHSCRAQVNGSNVSFVGGSLEESESDNAFQRFTGTILDIGSHSGTRTYRIQWRATSNSAQIQNPSLTVIEMSV